DDDSISIEAQAHLLVLEFRPDGDKGQSDQPGAGQRGDRPDVERIRLRSLAGQAHVKEQRSEECQEAEPEDGEPTEADNSRTAGKEQNETIERRLDDSDVGLLGKFAREFAGRRGLENRRVPQESVDSRDEPGLLLWR